MDELSDLATGAAIARCQQNSANRKINVRNTEEFLAVYMDSSFAIPSEMA
jgi:hypothetical protein